MFGDHGAIGRVKDLAGPGRQVAAEELRKSRSPMKQMPVESFWRGRQADVARDPAQVGLFQVADREQGRCQLRLAQLVQEVALVLERSAPRSSSHWPPRWATRA